MEWMTWRRCTFHTWKKSQNLHDVVIVTRIQIPDPPVGEGKHAGIALLGGAQPGPPVHNLGADFKTLESFENNEEKEQEQMHCHAPSYIQHQRDTEIIEGKSLLNS